MKIINYKDLNEDFFENSEAEYIDSVRDILKDVKKRGDLAVKEYTKKFDKIETDNFQLTKEQIKELNEKAAILAEQLKALSKNKSILHDNYKFVLQLRKGPVEYYRIPELRSIDLDLYRKDNVITWKLDRVS